MSIIRRPWRGRALLGRARLHATAPLTTSLLTGLALASSLLVASPATTVHATVDLAPLTPTTVTPATVTPTTLTTAAIAPAATDPIATDPAATSSATADLAATATTTDTANSYGCVVHQPTGRWRGRDHEDQWAAGLYPARERYPERWLALTFDDGPHPTRTPVVLELLAEHDLHATFFLTGFAIRSSTYHLVQQMVEQGHTLANHGWRHDIHMADQSNGLDLEAYIEAELELTQIRVDLAMLARDAEDFAAMDERVFGRLHRGRNRQRQLDAMPGLRERHQALLKERGVEAGDRPVTLRWVRPPGGRPYMGRYSTQERSAFARVLGRMDLTLVMWNGGSGDSDPHLSPRERMDPARITKTIRKAARRGGIYVAHDRIAARGLRAMIEALADSDAEVVSLERLRRAKYEARGWCAPTEEPAGSDTIDLDPPSAPSAPLAIAMR